jgi:hypothetical protein
LQRLARGGISSILPPILGLLRGVEFPHVADQSDLFVRQVVGERRSGPPVVARPLGGPDCGKVRQTAAGARITRVNGSAAYRAVAKVTAMFTVKWVVRGNEAEPVETERF